MSNSGRETVLVSHANPEDNAAALWFARKLRLAGYGVFLDLWLPAGADFWQEIERTLRNQTIKMVFLASRSSNGKPGTLKELALADTMSRKLEDPRFIIPLLLDDLPFSDLNIHLTRLNVIASRNWAVGMRSVLEALELAHVPRACTESDVGTFLPASVPILPVPESYLSNWFEVELPDFFRYRMSRGVSLKEPTFPCDWTSRSDRLYSFATAEELAAANISTDQRLAAERVDLDSLGGEGSRGDLVYEARSAIQELMGRAFARHCLSRGLVEHRLASKRSCFYFPLGLTDGDKVRYATEEKRASYRQLAGQRLRAGTIQHWHFGLSARLRFTPRASLVVESHVLFSDDGRHAWRDSAKQHRARRRLGRTWWNAEWRDRILACMWLLGDGGLAAVPVSPSQSAAVSCHPVRFDSPVSYAHPSGETE